MTYKIILTSDEVVTFKRTFNVNPDISFLTFHKVILASVGYTDDQMTSFFLCNEHWEKGQEVTLVAMDKSFEYDNMTMEETKIRDLLVEKNQHFIYIFDPLNERCFYGIVADILPGDVNSVQCVEKIGKAPKQIDEGLFTCDNGKNAPYNFMDDEGFCEEGYDADDIDAESFEELSFEDGTMF